MSSKIHATALKGALIVSLLTALAPAVLAATGAPAGATYAGPAATTLNSPRGTLMRPSATPPGGIGAMGPDGMPVWHTAAKPPWAFPAPLKGNPPAETWLPPVLSDEDRKHQLAVDRALMIADYIDSSELTNAGTLQIELRARDYDEMETQLDAVLAKFQTDPSYELLLQSMANFAEEAHVRGNVADTALIQAWVAARPNSPWAHYSAGLRWSATAWQDRGDGESGDISDLQWKMVHEDEVRARAEIQAALKLNPKQPIAWVTLMNIDRTDTGATLDQNTADFNQATKQVPTSYLIADQYETTLQPRWMGSAGMMDDFAQSQLANVDRNPRFWELQGEALADSGCAACNNYHWDVSLKQYNAALSISDRPTWLAMAGEAALHVHRYALAHAYYERALAYRDDLQWRMFRDFSVELCDPSKTPEEVERYRRDVVAYGGLDNVQYPHGPDDCVVYQRELPWGAEPIPDTTGLVPYTIYSVIHPVYLKEPQVASMPMPAKSVTSPDGAWVVTLADSTDETHHLVLGTKAGGKTTEIYTSANSMQVGFTSDSKHLFVNDLTLGKEGGCRYIDPNDPSRDAYLKEKAIQWIADQHLSMDMSTLMVICSQFANDQILSAALSAQANGQRLFLQLNYDTVSGKLVAAQNY